MADLTECVKVPKKTLSELADCLTEVGLAIVTEGTDPAKVKLLAAGLEYLASGIRKDLKHGTFSNG